MSPPRFSRIVGTVVIGADFFQRVGLARTDLPAPRGLVDRLEDLSHPGVDVERVPANVRVFFEDTASLELHIRARWHPVARVFWWMLRPLFARVGQLALPLDTARVLTTMLALDPQRDGRDDVRGVIRTNTTTGETMQVFAYATDRRGDAPRMSVAIPWPFGHLAGMLRLDPVGEGREGPLAVALTSRRRTPRDGSGVWFVRGRLALRMPLEETFSMWSSDMPDAPVPVGERVWPDATILVLHEQRLFGWRVVEHTYHFRPITDATTAR